MSRGARCRTTVSLVQNDTTPHITSHKHSKNMPNHHKLISSKMPYHHKFSIKMPQHYKLISKIPNYISSVARFHIIRSLAEGCHNTISLVARYHTTRGFMVCCPYGSYIKFCCRSYEKLHIYIFSLTL